MNSLNNNIKGIGASPGIAIGQAMLLQKVRHVKTGITLRTEEEATNEIQRFKKAVKESVDEVEAIKKSMPANSLDVDILEVLIEFLQDEEIITSVTEKITAQYTNANDAVIEVIDASVEVLTRLNDPYFSARAADLQDAGNRLLNQLNDSTALDAQIPGVDTIIVAKDIAPSETILMDASKISGFVTSTGGKTSHAAIVARSKGIPAVVGCGADLDLIRTNDIIIIDGAAGEVIVNPAAEILAVYTERRNDFLQKTALLHDLKGVKAVTRDGVEIMLLANISTAADMEASFAFGSQGCGLLRTELLFMNRSSFPDEEEQFEFYKDTAIKAQGQQVIVRTLDIGGDKQLPYFNIPGEENPFLGYRAIRISLDRKDIFKTQLAAILRASVFGDLKIMLPMISNISEVRQAKAIIKEVKGELAARQITFNPGIALGIMIEIPSAAVTADLLAKEVDFFSIGTNDLCQYTVAVDRLNDQVTHLYQPFNPGVLRLIQNVIDQGASYKIHTGMCGELAGDASATLLLMGMGLREFSMSASSIPIIKRLIVNSSITKAEEICKHVMTLDNAEAIEHYLQECNKQ